MKGQEFIAGTMFRLIRKMYRIWKSIPMHVMGTITHVSTSDMVAALTFDDGPDPVFTPLLLVILEKYNVHATFFMIGKAAEQHPDLVQKIAQGGHAIGNHSWDHPSFPSITGRERRKQIRASAKAVAPYGQKLFRPPYGHQTVASRIDAILLRYKVIAWDMNACDWEKHDAQWMANRLINRLKPGSIILLHDTLWDIMEKDAKDRVPVLEALDIFLEKVSRQFRFVTIPELLRRGRVQKQNWYVKDHNDW
ncbi:putative oligosaccharide deacetylase [Candidatus Kuenenia stuttgartiensis]|uniref:Putative oligosaccharide deacetylase n=1 Tax=Kuenenia stuttgartiensis TaxID=174633 RepID=Q1Q6Z0_KUEST|nr:polysaccharide deacetylase family protein [Candidatus Kuenenia stuttgartiensis]QII12845.1 putative oligosaccharide deacetylase [Candidatus Kuenenia stuttgartiensis]CAJ73350.1 similar to oligosaccharide deacetylase [Candidatus Kuenenia stuttgartiensis]